MPLAIFHHPSPSLPSPLLLLFPHSPTHTPLPSLIAHMPCAPHIFPSRYTRLNFKGRKCTHAPRREDEMCLAFFSRHVIELLFINIISFILLKLVDYFVINHRIVARNLPSIPTASLYVSSNQYVIVAWDGPGR